MGEDRTTEGALDLWSAHSENPLSHKRATRRFTICPSWRTKNCKPCAALRFPERGFECRRVALVGLVDRGRHDHTRVEIDRMFGLVGEMRRAVLHLGDLCVGIGLARPVLVRQLLALALAIKTNEVVSRRRLGPRSPWPSASASRDRSRRCGAARLSAARRWLSSSNHRRRPRRPLQLCGI